MYVYVYLKQQEVTEVFLSTMAMKVSLCQSLCSSASHPSSSPRQTLPRRRDSSIALSATPRARPWWSQRGVGDRRSGGWGIAVECANLGRGPVEREMEDEAAEWMKAARLSEKCGESRGMVEILECLELEAIMGDDQGREPNDYNRRAQIFDRSARVFQALKERSSPTTSSSTTITTTTTNHHES